MGIEKFRLYEYVGRDTPRLGHRCLDDANRWDLDKADLHPRRPLGSKQYHYPGLFGLNRLPGFGMRSEYMLFVALLLASDQLAVYTWRKFILFDHTLNFLDRCFVFLDIFLPLCTLSHFPDILLHGVLASNKVLDILSLDGNTRFHILSIFKVISDFLLERNF